MSFRPEVQGSPLLPRRQRGGKTPKLERRGSLTMLLEGFKDNKETINSVITKLYRKADFDLAKAQRGIIFLDGMDKIGDNANISEFAKRQVCMKFYRYVHIRVFPNGNAWCQIIFNSYKMLVQSIK